MGDLIAWGGIGLGLLGTLGAAFVLVWSTRQDAARGRIDRHLENTDTMLTAQGNRLTAIESDMKHIPTAADIGALYNKMNEIGNQVSTLNGSVRTMTDMVSGVLKDRHTDRRV